MLCVQGVMIVTNTTNTSSITNILVVDDDKFILELLRKNLSSLGFNVFVAENSKQAKRLLTNEAIHCIMLDVMLGNESGFIVAKQLMHILPTPIVFMTAEKGDDVLSESYLSDGMDFLRKPFDMSEVASKIKTLSYIGKIDRILHKLNKGN